GFAHSLRLDWTDARRELDQAIGLNPDNALALYLRSVNRANHGERAEAFADYSRAVSVAGDSNVELAARGVTRLFLHFEELALEDLDSLRERMQGRGAGVWTRGFARWVLLLQGWHRDFAQRWEIGQKSLSDMNAAEPFFPRTPFIRDARADLRFR